MNGTRYRYYVGDASSHYFMKMIDKSLTHASSNPDGGLELSEKMNKRRKYPGIYMETVSYRRPKNVQMKFAFSKFSVRRLRR